MIWFHNHPLKATMLLYYILLLKKKKTAQLVGCFAKTTSELWSGESNHAVFSKHSQQMTISYREDYQNKKCIALL